MIKTLFIARHAHAPFAHAVPDHRRGLSMQGRMAATRSARFIATQVRQAPCRCIASDALRTHQTAEILMRELNGPDIQTHAHLYTASTADWQHQIENSADEILLLVGHNPTVGQLASLLSGRSVRFSPACVAQIQIEIAPDGPILPGKLLNFFCPED